MVKTEIHLVFLVRIAIVKFLELAVDEINLLLGKVSVGADHAHPSIRKVVVTDSNFIRQIRVITCI